MIFSAFLNQSTIYTYFYNVINIFVILLHDKLHQHVLQSPLRSRVTYNMCNIQHVTRVTYNMCNIQHVTRVFLLQDKKGPSAKNQTVSSRCC